jgi:sulfatase maturation enzyme AslB (radical SAM superfamily)
MSGLKPKIDLSQLQAENPRHCEQDLGLAPESSICGEFCGKGVAIEHDGSVYSCDHSRDPESRLGTSREKPASTWSSRRQQARAPDVEPLTFRRRATRGRYRRTKTEASVR